MGPHDDSIRTANQLMHGVDTQFEVNLVRQQPQPGFSAGAAYGAGIGNLSGWVVFFGAVGLILTGIATRSWIGSVVGALAFAALPTGIAMLAGKFRLSLPRIAVRDEAAKTKRPRSLAFWIALFAAIAALAGVGFTYAVEAPDAAPVVSLVFAAVGAALGCFVWGARRVFRRKAN
jgi:hypothetical protein